MSAKAKSSGLFVCPQNGVPSECSECEAPFPHVREEWLQKGQKIPTCETHQVKLQPPMAVAFQRIADWWDSHPVGPE